MKIKGAGGANFSCVNIYILAFFLQRSWDIALGPLKQIPMNFFIMWMAGNSISIFPIMMVGMMFFKPIQAFISVQNSKWYWQYPSLHFNIKQLVVLTTSKPSSQYKTVSDIDYFQVQIFVLLKSVTMIEIHVDMSL